jgi:hypothetical protein
MKTSAPVLGACLMLLMAAPRARAEEAPSAADWLASGHHKKRIGIALMATGGAIAVVGTGLMIGGAWQHDDHFCHGYGGYYDRYGAGYDDHCGNRALTVAGATTTALGIGTIIPGIFVYANGGAEIDEGRRLARQCGAFCWEGYELRRSP